MGTPVQAQATAGPWAWAHLQRQACHRQPAKLHPEVIKGGMGYGGARKLAELTTVCGSQVPNGVGSLCCIRECCMMRNFSSHFFNQVLLMSSILETLLICASFLFALFHSHCWWHRLVHARKSWVHRVVMGDVDRRLKGIFIFKLHADSARFDSDLESVLRDDNLHRFHLNIPPVKVNVEIELECKCDPPLHRKSKSAACLVSG